MGGTVRWPEVGRYATGGENEQLVTDIEVGELMGDDDDRPPPVRQVAELLHQDAGDTGVEAGGGLVEKEQGRLCEQLGHDVRAFAFSPGELVERCLVAMGDPQLGQQIVDSRPRFRRGDIDREPEPSRVLERRADGELAVEHVLLGHEPDAVLELGIVLVQVATAVQHLALVSRPQPGQRRQQR